MLVFFCVGVMYSGEYDVCDVTLSVYPHRAGLKICLATVGIEPTTVRRLEYQTNALPTDSVAQLAEHWASIPKVVGSIPTVARHIFQACPVWIYTQSNITSIIMLFVSRLRTKRLYARQRN